MKIFKKSQLTNTGVYPNRQLCSQQNRSPLIVFNGIEVVGLFVERLVQIQIGAVLCIGAVLAIDLQRAVLDL
jgi:hypothetical protein